MQARGTTTLNKPPASPLFDCQQRIKKLVPTPSASVAPALIASSLVVSVSVPVPIAAPQAPATSMSSITKLLLLQLLQTQQMTMHALHAVVPPGPTYSHSLSSRLCHASISASLSCKTPTCNTGWILHSLWYLWCWSQPFAEAWFPAWPNWNWKAQLSWVAWQGRIPMFGLGLDVS